MRWDKYKGHGKVGECLGKERECRKDGRDDKGHEKRGECLG